jgi:hypothetical protein
MPQTSVLSPLPIGVAGQLADLWTIENGDVISAISEEVSAALAFGIGVKKGAADDGVLNLTAITDSFYGIIVYSPLFSQPDELNATLGGLVPRAAHFGLLRMGRVFVFTETNVTPASSVFLRAIGTGPNPLVGGFRGTADSTNTIDISAVASWRTTASAGSLAVLEIDLLGV